MMNPANIMKIMNAKNKFTANHPKFVAFLSAVFSREMEKGAAGNESIHYPDNGNTTGVVERERNNIASFRQLVWILVACVNICERAFPIFRCYKIAGLFKEGNQQQ